MPRQGARGHSGQPTAVALALQDKGTGGAAACRTTVFIGGQAVDAIVDTGAARTMLSRTAYEAVVAELGSLQPTTVRLKSANGQSCKLMGEVEATFHLQGQVYTQLFVVGEMGNIELLLSIDFIQCNGACIDLGEQNFDSGTAEHSYSPG